MIEKHQNRPKMEKKLVCRGGGGFIVRCFLYLIFMVSGAVTLRPGGWLNKKAAVLDDDWAPADYYYQPYLAPTSTKAQQSHQNYEPTQFKSFSLSKTVRYDWK